MIVSDNKRKEKQPKELNKKDEWEQSLPPIHQKYCDK